MAEVRLVPEADIRMELPLITPEDEMYWFP
ncbi:hypothetical protein FHW04_004146 [Pantoea sp. AN62]|jgi:hypothetical protein